MCPSYTLPSLLEHSSDTTCQNKSSSSKINIATLLSSPPLSPTNPYEYPHRTDSKMKRKRATPEQLAILNHVFNKTYFPSTEVRKLLGKDLGMSPRTVQIWFQNKRQALRTRRRSSTQDQVYLCLPPISPPTTPNSDVSAPSKHNQQRLPPLRLPF
ncbi:hypothetical protein BY458DRAFT_455714, partial [Sporodiniella umbellata]